MCFPPFPFRHLAQLIVSIAIPRSCCDALFVNTDYPTRFLHLLNGAEHPLVDILELALHLLVGLLFDAHLGLADAMGKQRFNLLVRITRQAFLNPIFGKFIGNRFFDEFSRVPQQQRNAQCNRERQNPHIPEQGLFNLLGRFFDFIVNFQTCPEQLPPFFGGFFISRIGKTSCLFAGNPRWGAPLPVIFRWREFRCKKVSAHRNASQPARRSDKDY